MPDRPHQAAPADAVLRLAVQANARGDLATVRSCLAELTMYRRSKLAKQYAKEIRQLRRSGTIGASVRGQRPDSAWLEKIKRVVQKFSSKTDGTASVYVAILRDAPEVGQFAVYIGETGIAVEARYKQHKSGYKASRHVRQHGIGLAPDLFRHLNPMSRDEAKDLEGSIATALRAAGIAVYGGH